MSGLPSLLTSATATPSERNLASIVVTFQVIGVSSAEAGVIAAVNNIPPPKIARAWWSPSAKFPTPSAGRVDLPKVTPRATGYHRVAGG